MNRYNFNNFKNLIPVNSMAVVISILALFVAVSSGNTPCLSADSVCSSGVDPEYTNNLSVKAGTTNKATITHNNLNGDNQYFFPESNYSRTSSVAVLKKGSDQLNILDLNNGSIIVGQSLTTTVGALRVQTSSLPVLQLYGSSGWQDVSSQTNDISSVVSDSGTFNANQNGDTISILGGTGVSTSITGDTLTVNATNDIGTVTGNTGSFSSSSASDTVNIVGSGGISTSITGDTLTISSSGGGTPISAYFGLNADQTTSSQNGVPFNVEKYDTDNCFTLNYSSVGSDITYTCADTRVFKVGVRYHFYKNSSFGWNQYVGVNLSNYPSSYQIELYGNSYTAVNGGHDTGYVENYICLEQNEDLEFVFGSMPNGVSMRGSSQLQRNNVQLSEDSGLTVLAQSNGCTRGVID